MTIGSKQLDLIWIRGAVLVCAVDLLVEEVRSICHFFNSLELHLVSLILLCAAAFLLLQPLAIPSRVSFVLVCGEMARQVL